MWILFPLLLLIQFQHWVKIDRNWFSEWTMLSSIVYRIVLLNKVSFFRKIGGVNSTKTCKAPVGVNPTGICQEFQMIANCVFLLLRLDIISNLIHCVSVPIERRLFVSSNNMNPQERYKHMQAVPWSSMYGLFMGRSPLNLAWRKVSDWEEVLV